MLSSDTMNATLLAMTNSAAESFIIMNSIFFGNSDIGIYTVVGETAFYCLIIQGVFYFLADRWTKIDWWIISWDTFFVLVYLGVFSAFLFGNNIALWKAIVLMVVYIIHILLMKFNYIYEFYIKKTVSRFLVVWEQRRWALKEIAHYYNPLKNEKAAYLHQNIDSWSIWLEDIKDIKFEIDGKYLVVDGLYWEKANPKYLAMFVHAN